MFLFHFFLYQTNKKNIYIYVCVFVKHKKKLVICICWTVTIHKIYKQIIKLRKQKCELKLCSYDN